MASTAIADIDAAVKAGNLSRALQLAKRARRRNPRDVNLLNVHGNLLTQAGRSHEAVPVFEQALKLMPGHPVLRFNLATAHMAGQDYAAASPSKVREVEDALLTLTGSTR